MSAPAGTLASAPPERESLADNLIRCLVLLADEPARFARAATSWHAHWCLCVPQLTLADAVRARRAVDALAGPDAVPAARSLRALFDRHGLHDLADALERWLDGHADYEVAR
jgi:hypothetical protein